MQMEDRAGLVGLPKVFDALSRLSHPNVVKVEDYGWLSGARFIPVSEAPEPPPDVRFYYAREWVEGTILRNRLDNEDTSLASLRTTLDIVEGIAVAARALHEQGILHLDLNPANVILPRVGGPLRLIGLGSCWPLLDDFPGIGDRGTPGYTAPELYAEGSVGYKVSYAADIFSLAVILFEMVSGRKPFGMGLEYLGYWSELTRRSQPFRLPMQFEGGWGDGLLAAHLHWCLEGMPRRRPQTLDEFVAPIRLLRRALPASALGGNA